MEGHPELAYFLQPQIVLLIFIRNTVWRALWCECERALEEKVQNGDSKHARIRMMCLIPCIRTNMVPKLSSKNRVGTLPLYIHPVQYIVAIVVTTHPTTVAPSTTLALTRTNCRSDSAISMCSLVMGRRSGRDQ